ncbi:MAG: L-serine ammonia-lyase, iron-sulfur-dependent, subunit alpha [Bacteroidaceae bacterium]|nr:L-serine ammonia-lyase, iron-sulfur-dependent, subunit alpha [Bacteroidaceae bacterium]
MTLEERQQIIKLIQREVVTAIGCTEPIAVALCVAKATELLDMLPEHIDVLLSANILKNAMGVGIPGTGMIGLPIAVALGALIGKSEYQLEVLRDCTPDAVENGKQYIDEKRINIELKDEIADKLYIEVNCCAKNKKSIAIIAGGHTRFVYLEKDGVVELDRRKSNYEEGGGEELDLNFRKVYDFAMTAPLDEIRFILDAARLNKQAAEFSFKGNYGHGLGRMLQGPIEESLMGNSIFTKILAYTSGACDARMGGAMIPVMSNSGSGNQGISCTNPVLIYAEETGKSEEELIRALMLSHLAVIYIKQSLGRLSALCGCVVASTGSSCGITYLMGGTYEQITFAVKNMIANLTGMICDGAKPSCALKVTTGVSTAVLSAVMAMENRCVTSLEGIIEGDVDNSIHNLTEIGAQGMNETDRLVLQIMTSKH